ncbi:hypothetical protein [Kribbella sp. VKM Ac-2568]|uniref:hypothetical protein n=1 Tax=Kribbella sp. VKM Ac-2568 TaxID=2512219 RepID=UPI00104F62FC|nr:hypothetical protein [Kribbella sp. VKM Ac-2568]TCM37012.1 hypothetical protein EV648_12188 [Kribbella sp. VKM Ac-2568]
MTSDVKTPDLLRGTIRDGAQDASAVKVHDFAWLEFEKPDLDRDEVEQAAGNAVVDAFTVPWKSEVRP